MRHVLVDEPSPSSKNRIEAFSVLRVPFFLEPDYNEDVPFIESNRERLIKKWGGAQGWEIQKQRHNLKGRGEEAGIPHFNLDRLAANSMASHRLIQMLGKLYGLRVSEAVYDALNVYYFVDGHSLNDKPRLAKTVAKLLEELVDDAVSQPMNEDQLLRFLQGDEGRAEIETARALLDQMGVHGIPKFIIGGFAIVDGAARWSEFVDCFRSIESNPNRLRPTVFGSVLGVSAELVERGSHTKESFA